jgi:hypothetical protein
VHGSYQACYFVPCESMYSARNHGPSLAMTTEFCCFQRREKNNHRKNRTIEKKGIYENLHQNAAVSLTFFSVSIHLLMAMVDEPVRSLRATIASLTSVKVAMVDVDEIGQKRNFFESETFYVFVRETACCFRFANKSRAFSACSRKWLKVWDETRQPDQTVPCLVHSIHQCRFI